MNGLDKGALKVIAAVRRVIAVARELAEVERAYRRRRTPRARAKRKKGKDNEG